VVERRQTGGFGLLAAALAAVFLFVAALFGRIEPLWPRVLLVVAAAALAVYVGSPPQRRRLRAYFEEDALDDAASQPAAVAPGFDDLVAAALDALPPDLRASMSNVELVVDDEPPPGLPLLGLYQGVPLTRRTWTGGGWMLPDKITIYRGPLERLYGDDPERLGREVQRVVLHEVAHHFGISDERLVELDAY
jgi:predicted Zn-dependent protease with MMP-like domain